jgi:hypothetical protein
VELHLKLSRDLLDMPFLSILAGWTYSLCNQVRLELLREAVMVMVPHALHAPVASDTHQWHGVLTAVETVGVTIRAMHCPLKS